MGDQNSSATAADMAILSEILATLFGGDRPELPLSLGHVAGRSQVMYVIGLIVVRAGKSRLLARATALDLILAFILGSLISRGINGSASLSGTTVAVATLVALWETEVRLVQPRVIVCLGALAAQAVLGRDFRLTRQRGKPVDARWVPCVIGTWHPSAVLRAPDENVRRRMRDELTRDVRRAAQAAAGR